MKVERIIAIDPGKKSIAWALFYGPDLRRVGFVRSIDHQSACLRGLLEIVGHTVGLCDEVVTEVPRYYPYRRNKKRVNPNDLIDLALTAGACTILGKEVRFVYPREWKGSVPKEIHQSRLKNDLVADDIEIIGKFLNNEHVIDAVGLGKWWAKRPVGWVITPPR